MATIIKRGPGQWQARVRKKGYPQVIKTFSAKRDAEMWAREIESEMERGVYRSRHRAESVTLRDVLERYLTEVTPTKKGHYQETRLLQRLMQSSLAGYYMAALTPELIVQYRQKRLGEVKPATVRRELATLGGVIQTAIREWEVHIVNPVAQVRKPAAPQGRNRVITRDEEARLLEVLRPEAGVVFVVALESAMRLSEILGLTRDDADCQRRIVRLEETKAGVRREVPLSSRAIESLKSLPARLDRRYFGITRRAMSIHFMRCTAKLGIEDCHFHDTRHTALTRLAEAGWNPIELAVVSGHRDLRMLGRYVHLRAEDLARRMG